MPGNPESATALAINPPEGFLASFYNCDFELAHLRLPGFPLGSIAVRDEQGEMPRKVGLTRHSLGAY
jgi:hypothetical protein